MFFKFLKSSYEKLKTALAKTRSLLGQKLRTLFQGSLNADTLEQVEQVLYEADLGVQTARELTQKLQESYYKKGSLSPDEMLVIVRQEVLAILRKQPPELTEIAQGPLVLLIVGVNGNGKTTSVAKLAKKFSSQGKKVLVAAADTFRAAATEQLEIWAQRIGVDIVKGTHKGDPAAVVFDAVTAAKARAADVLIIDTAGRLHTKTHLMQELEKIRRTCQKIIPDSPHETLLILDATTGQNAIDQAKIFHQFTPITGLILTKLDGTAKGGIVISIQRQLGIPVKFIGIGEGMDDLEPFDAESFTSALFE